MESVLKSSGSRSVLDGRELEITVSYKAVNSYFIFLLQVPNEVCGRVFASHDPGVQSASSKNGEVDLVRWGRVG